VSAPVKIELETDVGKLSLTLEPDLAPVAVTRVADLVKSGFYNGMVVHRVVPAFVSQWGSPSSDGFGGAPGKPALPCETSPVGYRVGSVGVALAGRDTGGSQLFVTHLSTPHLDGKYALLGSATGAWDTLIDGDIIQKARIVE
jgi:cyclophilin family peptidyl-prolyl cis-trans isomerase